MSASLDDIIAAGIELQVAAAKLFALQQAPGIVTDDANRDAISNMLRIVKKVLTDDMPALIDAGKYDVAYSVARNAHTAVQDVIEIQWEAGLPSTIAGAVQESLADLVDAGRDASRYLTSWKPVLAASAIFGIVLLLSSNRRRGA